MKLYELNQSGYYSLPKMTKAEIETAKEKIDKFLLDNIGGFFMLLCNELHYYTILYLANINFDTKKEMIDELFQLLQQLGTLKAVEVNDSMVEFWVSNGDECHMYAFFNYDQGVIKYE